MSQCLKAAGDSHLLSGPGCRGLGNILITGALQHFALFSQNGQSGLLPSESNRNQNDLTRVISLFFFSFLSFFLSFLCRALSISPLALLLPSYSYPICRLRLHETLVGVSSISFVILVDPAPLFFFLSFF